MITVLPELAAAHVPIPLAVKVMVTLPAVISAMLGVYVAVVSDVALARVPVPLDVHATLD